MFENIINMQEYADMIVELTRSLDVTIVCEPGRSMVANAGYLLTKCMYEKQNGNKRFVVVDAAMNDMLRPTLYNAYHQIKYLGDNQEDISPADVVGPICESGDWLSKNVELPKTSHNDLLLLHSAGAYGFTMSSNYNTRNRVAEVAIESGKDRLIRDRECFEDQIRLEIAHLGEKES